MVCMLRTRNMRIAQIGYDFNPTESKTVQYLGLQMAHNTPARHNPVLPLEIQYKS
jgi:hypothetical protein